MSSWEQTVEPKDPQFQYLLVAAEPYETIAFKIPNLPIDKEGGLIPSWDRNTLIFKIEFHFKPGSVIQATPGAAPFPGPGILPTNMSTNPLAPSFR
jgi:splicing factor 3A subunit 2